MKKMIFIMAALVVAGMMFGALDSIHPFGEPGDIAMDQYFIDNALEERSAENIVTSIVFDYRAFDTIGEAAVLFTAVCSILALFREGARKQ